MCKGIKGFTLLETVIASSIIFLVIALTVPLQSIIKTERKLMLENREIAYILHAALLDYLSIEDKISEKVVDYREKELTITFSNEDGLVTSCITWLNSKENRQVRCLYGWDYTR